jgi:hypothetical protein
MMLMVLVVDFAEDEAIHSVADDMHVRAVLGNPSTRLGTRTAW